MPAWNDVHRELPFVFTGSAAASGAGLGMLLAPVAEAGPARRLAVVGAAAETVLRGRDRFGWMAPEPLALSVQKREVVSR